MKKEEVFKSLFGFSIPTFYNWQRENRPIIQLLDKYFTKQDLEEFLQNGSIKKLDLLQDVLHSQSQNYLNFYNHLGNNLFDSPAKLLFFKSLSFDDSTLLALKKIDIEGIEEVYSQFVIDYLNAGIDSYITANKPSFDMFYSYCNSNGLQVVVLFHQIEMLLALAMPLKRMERVELRKKLTTYSAYTRSSTPLQNANAVEAMDDLEKELELLRKTV